MGLADAEFEEVKNAEVLMLDDPGKEGVFSEKSSEFSIMLLDRLFRHRVSMGLPTIVAANLSPDQFARRYAESVASLMTEGTFEIEVPGSDFRNRSKALRAQEIAMGISRPVLMA